MSPKVLKATGTVKVQATITPVTLPTITQVELVTYHAITQEAEKARKVVKQYEKSCEAFLSLITGLEKNDYLKLSPDQLENVLNERLHKQFDLEPGDWDFQIDTKSERGLVSWKKEFIKEAGEAKAAMLKAKAPKSFSHRFIAVALTK